MSFQNVDVPVACPVGTNGGKARCRNQAGKCSNHSKPEFWSKAPTPDTVLVKVNINKRWLPLFQEAVPRLQRTYAQAQKLEQERVARAKALGRDAYTVRDERDAKATPESADSGCPVFGKSGLAELQVNIGGLARELEKAGYELTFANLLHRDWKPPVRLVLEFSKKGTKAPLEDFPWRDFEALIATTFDQVDVWANDADPNKEGRVVHTVNCGKRNDEAQPKLNLRFANGDWAVEPVSVPATAA